MAAKTIKKLNRPGVDRPRSWLNNFEAVQAENKGKQKQKRCRRTKKQKNKAKKINLLYANIQGFTGKKTSLQFIMNTLEADIVLLAETMTRKVALDGCQCIIPKDSVGQNVAIILAGIAKSCKKMKLYDPNEKANMIGVRLEINQVGIRVYTAHFKQQSTNSREDITCQFEEMRNQFKSANLSREPMIMVFDANVHVGSSVIDGCQDQQDNGGKLLMSIVNDEGLTVVNSKDICVGCVTRVDPRNGSVSTIDLAVCNTFMLNKIKKMSVDEGGEYRLTKYGKKVTQTDHNTITLEINADDTVMRKNKCLNTPKIYNIRNECARSLMKNRIENNYLLDRLFVGSNANINSELNKFMKIWNDSMEQSFQAVKPSRNQQRGVDLEVRKLLQEESKIRKSAVECEDKGRRIAAIQKLIANKIAENVAAEVEAKVNRIIRDEQPQTKVFNVRRNMRKTCNVDFPLKDENDVLYDSIRF